MRTGETADKHEHLFPPYINAFALSLFPSEHHHFLTSQRLFETALLLNSPGDLLARHGRHGHPAFNGRLILPDVSYLVHTFILYF